MRWRRITLFSEEERYAYEFIYSKTLEHLSPSSSNVLASNFTLPRLPSEGLVPSNPDRTPLSLSPSSPSSSYASSTFKTLSTSSSEGDVKVVVYNVYTNVTVPKLDRTEDSVRSEIEGKRKALRIALTQSMGLTWYDPDEKEPLPLCANGVYDISNGETDVDCGGLQCPKCSNERKCLANVDCRSGACVDGFCTALPENVSKATSFGSVWMTALVIGVVTLGLVFLTQHNLGPQE